MDQSIEMSAIEIENTEQEEEECEMKEEHLEAVDFIDSPHEEELQIVKFLPELVKKTRKSLTIETKMEIIRRSEQGESSKDLAKEFSVGRTTISDILKRKYKFFKFITMNADKSENLKRRRTLRRTVHKVLEDNLIEWYNQLRDSGAYISGPMIASRAQELHKELGYTDTFTASNGWLDRFKVRNGIKLCGLREVKTESDINAVGPFKSELESLALWYNLSLEQIYNADESDLFWRMLPNPTQDMNEVKSSVRAYRERLTVLCCSNATGSHKLPLVCIGRGKPSRTFTSQELRNLPVQYYSQETAWMDSEIFKDWFHSKFIPSVRQHLSLQGLPENALLLIDRNASHPDDQHLRSEDNCFFVQYFPAKVKTLVQPMEQGIIRSMKLKYRFNLLNELIDKNQSLAEYYKSVTVKDGIRLLAKAWDEISPSIIQKCFAKIFPAYEDVTVSDNDTPSIEVFMSLIQQIPECIEHKYNQERLQFWLSCDEADPIRDRSALSICNLKAELKIDDESMKIYDHYEEEVPQAIEIITAANLKHPSELHEEEILQETEIDILSHPNQDALEEMKHTDDDEFLYEENLNADVSCEQAIDALETVLNFMKNDSESRYRDVVFLSELKKKLKRRLNDFTELKVEKREEFL